jgi:hypothetical protein
MIKFSPFKPINCYWDSGVIPWSCPRAAYFLGTSPYIVRRIELRIWKKLRNQSKEKFIIDDLLSALRDYCKAIKKLKSDAVPYPSELTKMAATIYNNWWNWFDDRKYGGPLLPTFAPPDLGSGWDERDPFVVETARALPTDHILYTLLGFGRVVSATIHLGYDFDQQPVDISIERDIGALERISRQGERVRAGILAHLPEVQRLIVYVRRLNEIGPMAFTRYVLGRFQNWHDFDWHQVFKYCVMEKNTHIGSPLFAPRGLSSSKCLLSTLDHLVNERLACLPDEPTPCNILLPHPSTTQWSFDIQGPENGTVRYFELGPSAHNRQAAPAASPTGALPPIDARTEDDARSKEVTSDAPAKDGAVADHDHTPTAPTSPRRRRMTRREANDRAMELATRMKEDFFRLSSREQARQIGCSYGTWMNTPLYKKMKEMGLLQENGNTSRSPRASSFTSTLEAVKGQGRRDEVLN